MLTPEDLEQVAALIAAAEHRTVQAIAAVVQAEIKASDARTSARIEDSDTRTRARIEDLDAHTRARIEETETKLLTEFHKWASPNEARQRTHTAAIRAIDLEMEAISERVAKLEGKQPPQ
jgi:hypothetical protein